jgi:hypothetical protein
MPNKPATKVKTGTTEVAVAQTPVALCPKQEFAAVGVFVQSDPNNAGAAVAVGDSAANAKATIKEAKGLQLLKAGAPVFLEVVDPASLFIDVTTSKDNVLWTILFA